MTAEAAVLNRSAVAMAADSKATLRISGVPKSHDAANKLFTLSKFHPVGIMINGNAEFMQTPWETIIKIYRDRLREKCLPVLEEYVDDFIFSLTSDYVHTEDRQQENVQFIVNELFAKICQRADAIASRKNSIDEAIHTSLGIASRELSKPDLPSMSGITPAHIRERYEKQIVDALNVCVTEVDEKSKEAFIDYACKALLKPIFSDGQSEVVVAGFGDIEIFPSLQSWIVDGVVADRLRCSVGSEMKVTHTYGAGIYPFAQREMVDRFMMGIDPDYRRYLVANFSQVLRSTAKQIIDLYGKGRKKAKELAMSEFQKSLDEALNEHTQRMQDYSFKRYAEPIINMTAQLPKDELAHLAESLVNLTSFKRRVSLDTESVGGAIDVAVISKSDGFIWIKRKHYFNIEKNRSFMRNYFRTHINTSGETAHERKAKQ